METAPLTYEAQALARVTKILGIWLNESKADDRLTLQLLVQELGI